MQAEFDSLVYVETPQGGSYMPANQSHVTLAHRWCRYFTGRPWRPRFSRSGFRFRKSRGKLA